MCEEPRLKQSLEERWVPEQGWPHTLGQQFRDVGKQLVVLEQVMAVQESKNPDPVLALSLTSWGILSLDTTNFSRPKFFIYTTRITVCAMVIVKRATRPRNTIPIRINSASQSESEPYWPYWYGLAWSPWQTSFPSYFVDVKMWNKTLKYYG